MELTVKSSKGCRPAIITIMEAYPDEGTEDLFVNVMNHHNEICSFMIPLDQVDTEYLSAWNKNKTDELTIGSFRVVRGTSNTYTITQMDKSLTVNVYNVTQLVDTILNYV